MYRVRHAAYIHGRIHHRCLIGRWIAVDTHVICAGAIHWRKVRIVIEVHLNPHVLIDIRAVHIDFHIVTSMRRRLVI